MNDPAYRAGVLRVTKEFHGGARALPPEHRVAAIADVPGLHAEDWLVEGPTLPLVPASGQPAEVMLTFFVHTSDAEISLTASWFHAPLAPWRLGQWVNYATFERDFGREFRDESE